MSLKYFIPDNEVCAACKIIREINSRKSEIAERRKEIKSEMKTLTSQLLTNPGFNRNIEITNKGVKEWLNQPHKYYVEKNEMLLNIKEVISKAKYIKPVPGKEGNGVIVHLFETKIRDEKSWIIIKEFPNGQISLYSISDSEKVLMSP